MKLIKQLQECSTLGQADPILTRLGAGPAVKKLVETALILSNSQDPQQRNHAYSFMESAIKELEDGGEGNQADPGLGPKVDDGIAAPKITEEEDSDDITKITEEEDDDDDEHKIHEEEVTNNNQGSRNDGSEQSTDNTEPYPGQGIDTTNGEKPMQDMDNTQNQFNETGGFPNGGGAPNGGGMIMPGLPPTMPGLDPQIAQEMGMQMPAPPPMDTNQMMRQMQYTVDSKMKDYHNRFVAPLNSVLKQQRETIKNQKSAIKELSMQLREISSNSGNMKLDLDSLKQNANARFRETESPSALSGYNVNNLPPAQSYSGVQPVPNVKRHKIATARAEIEQMDKILTSEKNPMYN